MVSDLGQYRAMFWVVFILPWWWESERRQSQDRWPQLTQGTYPDHMTSCSVNRVGEQGGRGDISGDCLLKSPPPVMGPCCSGDGRTPPCPWEAGSYFLVLLVWVDCAFPIKLTLSQPMNFPASTLLILLQSPWWRSEREWCLVLAGVKAQQVF